MKFIAHDYQNAAIDFIKEKRNCALFLEMGLGKTVTTLTAIQDLHRDYEANRILIVAPLRVANLVWQQEIDKWDHLNLTSALMTPLCSMNYLNSKLQAQSDSKPSNVCAQGSHKLSA